MLAKIYKSIVWVLRIPFYLSIVLVLALLFAAQTPQFQQLATNTLTNSLSEKTGYKVKVGHVAINWFDLGELENITIYDLQDSLMFSTKSILFDIKLGKLLRERSIEFDAVFIDGLLLQISKYNDSTAINLVSFIDALRPTEKNMDTTKIFGVFVTELGLENSRVRINDYRVPFDENIQVLQPAHLDINIKNLSSRDFWLRRDTITLDIKQMQADETNSTLRIDQLATNFFLDSHHLILGSFQMNTDYSQLTDSVAFKFDYPSQLSYFTDSVDLYLNLKNTQIAPEDLLKINQKASIPFPLYFSGILSGKVRKLDFENFGAFFGENSYLTGFGRLEGLPDINNSFVDFSIGQSQLSKEDYRQWVDSTGINPGDIRFTGQMMGFLSDFVTTGLIMTDHGVIETDINLKDLSEIDKALFTGKIKLEDFHLGQLIGDTTRVGTVNMTATVNGSGLSRETANFHMSAVATESEIMGNTIKRASANGRFSNNFFSGSFLILDEILQISGNTSIDLNRNKRTLAGNVDVDHIDIFALGLISDSLTFHSKISYDITGFSLDSASGFIRFDSLEVYHDQQVSTLTYLIADFINDGYKQINVTSPELSIEIAGNFLFTNMINDVPIVIKETRSLIFGHGHENLTEEIEQSVTPYKFDFIVKGAFINPVLSILNLPLQLSNDYILEGTYLQRNDVQISLYLQADTIYNEIREFYGNEIDINLSKKRDGSGVLALLILDSEHQDWTDMPPTERLHAESVWNNNKIDINFRINQPENQVTANLNSEITIRGDSILLKMLPSKLQALDKYWDFNRENLINITPERILFRQVELISLEQSISVEGVYSDTLVTQMDVAFENFQLENLSAFFPKKMTGKFDGAGRLSRSNPDLPMRFESNVTIDDLFFEDLLVGDLSGKSEWNQQVNGLKVDYQIIREGVNTINLNGLVIPSHETDQLQLGLTFDQASLKLLEPIFANLVSNVAGTASGAVQISGNFNQPLIAGDANLQNGRFKLDYLNTTYTFNGLIKSTRDTLKLENVLLKDRFGNNGSLSGIILHKNYKDWATHIRLEHQNFELLNTLSIHNKLFYGNAYGTGSLVISGPVSNLLIKSNATTAANTRLFIPVSSNSEVAQENYITFKQPKSADAPEGPNVRQAVDMSGITIDFDLNITEDTYAELIFDPRTGDIIRGRGRGNIQLKIDTNGEFELFGGLQIKEGAYNFTTKFINKEFKIVPDGTITWYGDPYEGVLNLEASYRQLADPQDWNPTASTGAGVSKRAPVDIILSLQGPMMSPEISYRLSIEENATFATDNDWRQLITTVNNNEEELRRQVFSLLMLRKFSPQNSFVIAGGGDDRFIGKSVSEFLSNQLSYWLNQVDDNLEIEIDLNNMDQDAFNTFQLRLAYSFLDGRLRITRGGGITTVVENQNTTSMSNILGDWSVEYLLTQDGRLRAKVFSRTNQFAQGNPALLDQQQQTGASLQFIKSFDDFVNLMRSTREESKSL